MVLQILFLQIWFFNKSTFKTTYFQDNFWSDRHLLPTLEQQDSTKLPRYYFVTRREWLVYSEATKIHSFVCSSQMLFIPLSGVNMRRIFSQFWFHEINPIWTSLRLWALAHKSYYNLASRIELIIWNLSTYNNKAEISLLWAAGRPKGNSIFALALASDLITKVEAGCTVQSSWRIAALLYLGYPKRVLQNRAL